MVKTAEISPSVRCKVIELKNEKKTYREIAKMLKLPVSTVGYIIKTVMDTGSLLTKRRTGRPKVLSERQERSIVLHARKHPFTSAQELVNMVETTAQQRVSKSTIKNVLNRANYHGRAARKKPFISEVNRAKRLAFAKEHLNKPISFWESVLFTDESKFNIFGSDGRRYVWRKPNEEFAPGKVSLTVKHGGGHAMVWGCVSSKGVGNLAFIDGNMTAKMYVTILQDNLKKSVEDLNLQDTFVFQQDNDPKHTAIITREWLLYNVRRKLQTPPQSPDINIIENLWHQLDLQVRKHKITGKQRLREVLQEEWHKIDINYIKTLVYSMPSRLQAIINANGLHTKY